MTGKELIIYILKHNLENADLGFIFSTFMTAEEFAAKCNVGMNTVRAWHSIGLIENAIAIGDDLYFPSNATDPRIKNMEVKNGQKNH